MRLQLRFMKLLLITSLLGIGSVAQAAESFVVSGPLNNYYDYYTDTSAYDYTYSSTIKYDSNAPSTYTDSSPPYYDISQFEDSIISIEFKIYNALGEQVVSLTNFGLKLNIAVVNDDSGSGYSMDYKRWYVSDYISSGDSIAYTAFYDSSNQMVTSVTDYPTVPVIGDFDYSISYFYYWDYITARGFVAHGPVTQISDEDPITACEIDAKNHGQFVSCVAKVTNALRKVGDITGKEKGALQSGAASKD